MKCPIDNAELIISDRQGVEIDYCPNCRGVWLDRGELDKLIERADSFQAPRHQERPERERHHDDDDDHDERRFRSDGHGDKRHHKKESFLGDLFDF